MEMMKRKRNVKVAWKNTGNMMNITDLQKRSISTQLYELRRRVKKKIIQGSESPLYAATCPYFYIIRVFGLAPYEFGDDQSLVFSNISIIYSILWGCIHTYTKYCTLLKFYDVPSTEMLTTQLTRIIVVMFNYVVVIFDLVFCWATRKRIATIWNGIQDYDEIVRELGYTRRERGTRIWVWSTIVIGIIIYIAINLTGMYAFWESWLDNVSYLITYVASAVSVMKFSGLVMLVAQRFNHLNEISRKSMSEQSRSIIGTPEVDIRIIEHLHNRLMKVAEDLNSIYSWSIIVWLSNLCFHNVSNLYIIILAILARDFDLDVMCCLLCWEVSFIAQLVVLNYVCHYASSKANCFNWIILGWKRQLFMHNRSTEIKTSFHSMNRCFNFSAAGCFNVDLPLLCSIVSSLTTYLIILLQFE